MLKNRGCGDLRPEDAGSAVTLAGWVHNRRDQGGIIFIDLRDASGLVQVKFDRSTDPEAHAVMSDAVGEEYKHFSMDLEFLLRRTPKWRQIAKGVLFQEGDIVEHGEAAEAAADDDGDEQQAPAAAAPSDGTLGIGSLRGEGM